MGMVVIAGYKCNVLERIVTAPTASPSADANFGSTCLYDRFVNSPFRFGASSSASYIQINLNHVTNGDMETASTAGSSELGTWTDASGGTGDVTRTTVAGEFSTGTAGMKLSAGTSAAQAWVEPLLKSGERFVSTIDLRSTAAGITGKVRIQNRITGSYLSTGSTWGSTAMNAITNATSSFATVSLVATVEGYQTCKMDQVPLRITVLNDSTGTIVYADQMFLYPSVDTITVHGHNLDPQVAVTALSSTDGFTTATTEATFAVAQPSFYTALSSARDKQFWRVSFTGTNSTNSGAIYIGELVLAQKLTPGRTMNLDPQVTLTDHQIRITTNPAHARSYRQGDWETRELQMGFWLDSTSNFQEFLDEILHRSRFGHYPMIVIPLSTQPGVLYGKIGPSWGFGQPHANITRGGDVTLVELPFPTFVN